MTMCWQKSTLMDDKAPLSSCILDHVPVHTAKCNGTSPREPGYYSFIWWHTKPYRPALINVMTSLYVYFVNNSFSMSIITDITSNFY
jgi:hypothetical protein